MKEDEFMQSGEEIVKSSSQNEYWVRHRNGSLGCWFESGSNQSPRKVVPSTGLH
jgi:hypothetical protein